MTQGINCTVPRRGGIKRRREWSARMNHETDENNQTLLNRFALAAIQRRSRPICHLYGQLWYSSVCTHRRATRHTGSFVICCSINCQHSSQHMRTNRHIRTSYSSQLVSVRTSGYFKTWSRSTRDRENKFLTVCDLYRALSAELGSQYMQGKKIRGGQMASARRASPYNGSLGRCPQWSPGAELLVMDDRKLKFLWS